MQPEAVFLSALAPGTRARLMEVQIHGALRRRLFDLGLIPGTLIECRFLAPSGSPIAVRVRGTNLAIRWQDAKKLLVERLT